MSFEQKYLKYKSKYLALKSQLSNLQSGGAKSGSKFDTIPKSKSFYDQNILDLDNLSVTPSMMEAYGYNFNSYQLVGGLNTKTYTNDFRQLSKLLNVSDNVPNNVEITESSQSAGSNNESELNALSDTPDETPTKTTKMNMKLTGKPVAHSKTKVASESAPESETKAESEAKAEPESEVKAASEPESEPEAASESEPESEAASEPEPESESEPESEQQGGKNKVKSNKKYFFEDSDINLSSTTTDSELSSLDSDSSDSDDINL